MVRRERLSKNQASENLAFMYLSSIKPIFELTQDILDQAVKGELAQARKSLDRVRILRSRLSRSVESERRSVANYYRDNMGVELAAESADAPESLSVHEVVALRRQTEALSRNLSTIKEWLSSSMAGFTEQELFLSAEGVDLFLDNALPEAWDFSLDIAVLAGPHTNKLQAALLERGQKKFICLVTEPEEPASEHLISPLANKAPDEAHVLSMAWVRETDENKRLLKDFIGADIASLHLIGTSISDESRRQFAKISKLFGQLHIGKRASIEWPVVFTEQWIGQIHRLTEFPSVMELKPTFVGKDVLVASPGPSLSDSLAALKNSQGAFLIMAPIRSLASLFEAGVIPDFAFHVDATDFSKMIPSSELLASVPMLCFDHSHASVWSANFKQVFTVPDSHLLGSELSSALHGKSSPLLPGGSVSVVAVELAAAFGAKSITLLGQDLSISRGKYVEAAKRDAPGDATPEVDEKWLTCLGIDGSRLRTQEDYLWFISEFEQTARRYADSVALINSTSHGAYLEGWDHCPFPDDHPVLAGRVVEAIDHAVTEKSTRVLSPEEHADRCARIKAALLLEQLLVDEASKLCAELTTICQLQSENGDNDVSNIDALELALKEILSRPGSILQFYTSRYAFALKAALETVESLEENLLVSAEYYHQLGSRAAKLSALFASAIQEMEKVLVEGERPA